MFAVVVRTIDLARWVAGKIGKLFKRDRGGEGANVGRRFRIQTTRSPKLANRILFTESFERAYYNLRRLPGKSNKNVQPSSPNDYYSRRSYGIFNSTIFPAFRIMIKIRAEKIKISSSIPDRNTREIVDGPTKKKKKQENRLFAT